MTQGRSPSDEEWDDLVRRFFESSGDSSDIPEPEDLNEDEANTSRLPIDHERSDSRFRDSHDAPRDISEFFTEENSIVGVPHELDESAPELEEHFIPPEPRPIATGNPLTVLAWIGAAGGPLLLVVFAIAWRTAPFFAWFGAIAAAVAGISYLWWSLPKERDEYSNGAEL